MRKLFSLLMLELNFFFLSFERKFKTIFLEVQVRHLWLYDLDHFACIKS
jgi:hypothetical protein